MKLESITLQGELRGTIWLPQVECTKEFCETFTPEPLPFRRQWKGIRDALIYITDDGDFMECGVDDGVYMEVTYRLDNGDRLIRDAVIGPSKLIEDLFAD